MVGVTKTTWIKHVLFRIVAGLLDVVCIIWFPRQGELSQEKNKEIRRILERKGGGMLTSMFRAFEVIIHVLNCQYEGLKMSVFKEPEMVRSLVYLCSFLPHSSVSSVAGFCLAKVKAADEEADENSVRNFK